MRGGEGDQEVKSELTLAKHTPLIKENSTNYGTTMDDRFKS